jgi:hypothetical protein
MVPRPAELVQRDEHGTAIAECRSVLGVGRQRPVERIVRREIAGHVAGRPGQVDLGRGQPRAADEVVRLALRPGRPERDVLADPLEIGRGRTERTAAGRIREHVGTAGCVGAVALARFGTRDRVAVSGRAGSGDLARDGERDGQTEDRERDPRPAAGRGRGKGHRGWASGVRRECGGWRWPDRDRARPRSGPPLSAERPGTGSWTGTPSRWRPRRRS